MGTTLISLVLPGTHANNHFKFEDDFHRENGFTVERHGKKYSYRIDFDMSGQDLAETDPDEDPELAQLGFTENRRGTPGNLGNRLGPRGAKIAVVNREDIESLPIPKKHQPWFAPTKYVRFVGGSPKKSFFRLGSDKGWDERRDHIDFTDKSLLLFLRTPNLKNGNGIIMPATFSPLGGSRVRSCMQ